MNDLERKPLVAFPPVGEVFWSGVGPVGLLRYRAAGVPALAVAVRVTSPLPEAGEPFLPGVPFPALRDPPPVRDPAPLVARELVPFKHRCDVGLRGTLMARRPLGGITLGQSAGPTAVALEIQIDDTRRVLSVTLAGDKVDLAKCPATLLGGPEVPLGPGSIEPFDDLMHFHLDDDAERFHSAGAPLRFPYPAVGSRIAVQSDFFRLDAVLGFDVFVRVDYLDDTVSLPVARCDALTFDLDRRQVEWLFRAVAVDPAEGREIERVVVAALPPGQDEERSRVDAWLPHAVFAHAAGPEHVRAGAHPEPLDEEELAMARYSTWDAPHVASTLPIEEVAQIQVELLRGRDRAAVLEAHGLDTYHWSVEERAAMDRLAEAGLASIEDEDAARGEGSEDVARYREAHARALADTPREGREWSVKEYAELRAALEVKNPLRVLERAALGPAEVIGLDFEMQARLEASPAERKEYEQCHSEALARIEASAGDEDDFAPPEDDDDDEDDR